jgi:hypothetical protein
MVFSFDSNNQQSIEDINENNDFGNTYNQNKTSQMTKDRSRYYSVFR